MPRNDQISRIYGVLRLLENHPRGLTVREIHGRLNEVYPCSERTFRRDLDAIEQAGFPVVREPQPEIEERGGDLIQLKAQMRVAKTLSLSPGELFSLYLARGVLKPLNGTVFYEDLEKVFQKIATLMQGREVEHLQELEQEVSFEPSPRWGLGVDPEVLDTLRAGCANRQWLDVVYAPAGKKAKKRRIGPSFLYFAKGSLYLVGEDSLSGEHRTFSVSRVKSAGLSTRAYDKKPITPEEYFRHSFGVFRSAEARTIQVRFKPEVASYIRERRWHESQQLTPLPDGGLELTFKVGVTPDLVNWVLGFGPQARVIAPPALQEQVAQAAQQVLEQYPAPGGKCVA